MLQNLESEIQNKWNVPTNTNTVSPSVVDNLKQNNKVTQKNETNISDAQNNKIQDFTSNIPVLSNETNNNVMNPTLPNELYNQQQQQKQQQMQMLYHDIIYDHLFQCFTHSIYTDLKLRFQGSNIQEATFFLHKIICIRSPFLAQLISENEARQINLRIQNPEIVVPINDVNITAKGLSIALGHLYSSYAHHHLLNAENCSISEHSKLLRSVLASSHFLHLPDLCNIATRLICLDINKNTVINYCHFVNQPNFITCYDEFSKTIYDCVYNCLCKNVIKELSELNRQDIWQDREGQGYKQLIEVFSELPFEWMKKVVESKEFITPGEIDRYYFAKELISLRAHKQSPVVIGEENVVLAFGISKNSNISIVRKSPKYPTGSQERKVLKYMETK
ncbi:hypothetical protein BCR36DRAFT_321101 [Piromyces finnis]|uniref:BTB domain-containing protein n=1 Tax=Piromyces finnis TaxID=1754191 RepID=A0A1Y1VHI2_9FUNG|nr:hypothetical protein BCR36DRAFT_321101 [Piromyces finnis]|eukprot:ORX55231.1 hypothetical protein BCR36DRAFT_321101 [Piromyces finnis]